MERFQEAREKARRNLQIADHMIFMTYPLVNDNRLLLAIMENLFLSLTNAMGAILYYERAFKRVPPFHDNYESKLNLFKERCVPRYKLDKEYLKLLEEVKEIILEHKRSPVEFSRKEAFVICSESYKIRTVTVNQIKAYVAQAKKFLQEMERIVSKNEHLFS